MTTTVRTTRPPLWRDVRILRVVAQILAAAGFIALALWLYGNLIRNMQALGIRTDFRFLSQPTGVDIAFSDFEPGQPIWQALRVGIKNTFALVIVGVPLLTVIGVIVGVARLSTNLLVAKAAAIYVELLRNLPPLLIIFFAFNAVILPLPPPGQAISPFGILVVSNLAISVPNLASGEGVRIFLWTLVGAVGVSAILFAWRTRHFDRTGEPHHRWLWSAGFFVIVAVGAYLVLGRPITLSLPVLEGRIVRGGISGLGAYFAVLAALVLYTASHVAEIVRGSILAVPKGQTEAATALALSSFQRLRFVILPQAFRIAVPPVINQYLNFTKNTSLAIAIGYAEVTRISFQAIGNGHPAPQLIALLMTAYLLFSLTISLVLNIVNRRLQLVGR